jgi:imidazolonepropionase-like amidohydrolase
MSYVLLKGSVFNGNEHFENGIVVVDEATGTIADCGSQSEVAIPDQVSRTISGEGLTIVPGFIDAHLHFFGSTKYDLLEWTTTPEPLVALRSVPHLKKLLLSGFTAVRDLGSEAGTLLSRAVNEGAIEGPRIISAGKSLAQTGGNDDPLVLPIDVAQKLSYSYYCDGPWECRKAVRLCLRDGAECIKVYASGSFAQGGTPRVQLTVEELKAIVDESHRSGLKVAAHAYGETALMNAIEAGVDSIEHGIGLTTEIAERIKKQGIFYVPTLSAFFASKPSKNLERERLIKRHLSEDMEIAKQCELKVTCGSDFVGAENELHGDNYKEIVNLAKFFGNEKALAAATSVAADCLNLNGQGRIERGFEASLVVLKGDPLKNIEAVAPPNIKHVLKSGKIYTPN